jgi:hypothetical protein
LALNNAGWIEFYDDGTDLITTSTGAHLTLGGVWTNSSDRNAKENFRPLDRSQILDNILKLDITEWNYKAESDDIRHIGPMAQDFHAAFGVGNDDKTIATLDEAGVALAGIQALYSKSEEQAAEIEALKQQVANLQAIVETLMAKQDGSSSTGAELAGK